MATKLAKVDDETEGRRLAAAITRKFIVRAKVARNGKGPTGELQVVTDDEDVGREQLRRIRGYAAGWLDSLAAEC